MLGIDGSEFAFHGFHSPVLADNSAQRLRPYALHNRFGQVDRIEFFQFFQFFFRLWCFYIMQFFLNELHFDFLNVLLLLFFHTLGDFLFQPFFYSLAGQHFSQYGFQFIQDINYFIVRWDFIVRSIFIDQSLQAHQTMAWIFRMNISQGGKLARPENHFFRAN